MIPLGRRVGNARPSPQFLGPLPMLTHRGPTAVTQQRFFLKLSTSSHPMLPPVLSEFSSGTQMGLGWCVNQKTLSALSNQSLRPQRHPQGCDHGWVCLVMGPVYVQMCVAFTLRNQPRETLRRQGTDCAFPPHSTGVWAGTLQGHTRPWAASSFLQPQTLLLQPSSHLRKWQLQPFSCWGQNLA